MAKSKYLNFNEYAQNDKEYLMRTLKGELHRIQSKIEFKDGSSYHVTKSGSRYWEKNGRTHREDGPAGIFGHGKWYSLFGVTFDEDEYPIAVAKLNFLRLHSNNQLETMIGEIDVNMPYEKRQTLWRSIILGSIDHAAMLASLKKLSEHYNELTKMSDKFIEEFSI